MVLQLEHVNCDLCGSTKYKVLYRKPDNWLRSTTYMFPVVKCDHCGLVYVNPRPTQEAMSAFYPPTYDDERSSSSAMRRYDRQMAYLPVASGDERLLDVGSARGDFLAAVKDRWPQMQVTGTDLFSSASPTAGIDFFSGDLTTLPLGDHSFDIATAWAVFEHLHSPTRYFETLHRLLKPGGKFIALVTNADSAYGRFAYTEDVPRHTYHFSRETLSLFAEKTGFKLIDVKYTNDIFDGRGFGTFRYQFMKALGWSWEREMLSGINFVQRKAGALGSFVDKAVFTLEWESCIRRSGIIVATFENS
jgi:ubiquinone/menaquinone biosynthesis C-methylase UbiE